MPKLSKQDKKIYEYITDLRSTKEDIPYMTKISKDIGVSVATISRYASKKGFSNFAVLRDNYNNKKDSYRTTSARMQEVISFMRKSDELFIIPSNSCYSLGYHLNERLKALKYNCHLRARVSAKPEEFESIPRNAWVIFVTLSSNSAWYERYIKNMIPNKGLLITTKKPTKTTKHVKVITHIDKAPIKQSILEQAIARGKIMDWLDKTVTQLHLELLNEKKA